MEFSVRHKFGYTLSVVVLCNILALVPMREASAHCDGMDGPVVTASRKALDSADINHILIWIPKQSEPEVKDLFEKALAVRKQNNPEASGLADRLFYETVVRVHRAAEGASYTGLKSAGRDWGPAISAADKALEKGTLKDLDSLLTDAMRNGLKAHFEVVMHKQNFKKNDVEAGREYVAAYVRYIHYAEKLYTLAMTSPKGHYHEGDTE
jgi:hypothetical protein